MVSGYLGFLMVKPTSLLKSSSRDNFPASTSCMIAVAEKDFEIEAILKISLLVSSVLAAMSFKPKELL